MKHANYNVRYRDRCIYCQNSVGCIRPLMCNKCAYIYEIGVDEGKNEVKIDQWVNAKKLHDLDNRYKNMECQLDNLKDEVSKLKKRALP